jgi:Stress responsive A/B Barrel Domain
MGGKVSFGSGGGKAVFRLAAGLSPGERLGTMLVHTVIFWLRKDLTSAQREAFRNAGLESLRAVPSVSQLLIGSPASIPPRTVVDASYDFCLTVLFKDIVAHDAYQVDPAHKAFVAEFKSCWERVQIYDAQ